MIIVALALASAPPPFALPVLVGKADNLQYVAFYTAYGAGYFGDENIAVSLLPSDPPSAIEQEVKDQRAQAFVLSPPTYLRLMDDAVPIVVVANLLEGESVNLLVRPEEAQRRGLSVDQPLKEKLGRMRGLKIGVAPGPVSRIRAMFASVGLDADKDAEIVQVHGQRQNDAYGAGTVDALFCHTPFLEKAIVDQGARLMVRASAGEVPELSHMQVHTLAFTRAFIDAHPDVVEGAVTAIARAERLLHDDHAAAVVALLHAIPSRPRAHVEKLVELYAPAVPQDPTVDPAKVAQRQALFPAHQGAPTLANTDVASFFDARFAQRATRALAWRRAWPWAAGGGGAVFVALVVGVVLLVRWRRGKARA